MSEMIVTIDGPSGSGKSTVSKAVASIVGLPHLDTGAFYRAATLAIIRSGVDVADEKAVSEVVAEADLEQSSGRMILDGEDVSTEIRSEPVTQLVSTVAAMPEVRRFLVAAQRDWVERKQRRAVIEGRDIGSVVFPDANIKFYLDAQPEVRARRRAAELGDDTAEVAVDLARRDRYDSTRGVSPLQVPDGALVVDTTGMSFQEVVDHLVGVIESAQS